MTLPIFEGGRLRANLRGARADYDDAVAAYDGAVVQALHEVADTAASERQLTTRLGESRKALAAYEEAYRIARLRYDGGLANYQTVLLAEDSVLQAGAPSSTLKLARSPSMSSWSRRSAAASPGRAVVRLSPRMAPMADRRHQSAAAARRGRCRPRSPPIRRWRWPRSAGCACSRFWARHRRRRRGGDPLLAADRP